MIGKIFIPDEVVISKIYLVRSQKVMLDSHLAELYQFETRALNQQVKRNLDRFPEDFMFQLNDNEWDELRTQYQTESWGGRRKNPYVFTEHGVLMLSSVLNSKKAIAVNIQIMRIFTKLRDIVLTNKEILLEFEKIRKRVSRQDEKIELIYKYLKQFVNKQSEPRPEIGFKRRNQK